MSSGAEKDVAAENDRLRARVAELERLAHERLQVEYALGRERETSRRLIEAELRTRASQQAAVAELGQFALAAADVVSIREHAVRVVVQTLGVEFCQLRELSADSTALVLTAGVGWRPGAVGHAISTSPLDSQAGYTLLSNEPVVVRDLRTEGRFRAAPFLIEHGATSGVTVLMRGRDKPLAVLGVHTTRERAFTRNDVDFMQAVANVLTSAIERKSDEEALRKSEATARAFLESAAESIIVVNREGRIVLVNARTELMFGYRRGELIGQTLELLLPERVRATHVQHRTAYFAEPRVRRMGRDLVLAGRRQDGSEFPVEISLSYVETPEGLLAMAFVTDITERVELQRATRQSEKLAALGTLAAGIAHEINNPLGIISSRIEVMMLEAEHEPLPKALVDDLLTVHKHAERVARIAQGLLSFSRQSSTDFVLVDVNRVVEDTVLLSRGQIEKAGLALRLTLAPALPPVRGNASALGQVFLNLLTNARDASGVRGEIAIVTAQAADDPAAIDVAIADQGHGMDAETLSRIFDPFYTTKPTGTGLGLSIAYGIVRDHGGTISADSTPGQGTRFLIRLPVAAEDAQS
jgi:two-component system cell cycle sensor histidine kinase/response regulator CckA